jgi:hypothetical protein
MQAKESIWYLLTALEDLADAVDDEAPEEEDEEGGSDSLRGPLQAATTAFTVLEERYKSVQQSARRLA